MTPFIKKALWVFLVGWMFCLYMSISQLTGQLCWEVSADFGTRWMSAKMIEAGQDPYQMELRFDFLTHDWVRELTAKLTPYAKEIMHSDGRIRFDSCYLPSTYLLLIPFLPITFSQAAELWQYANEICSFAFPILCWYFLKKEVRISKWIYTLAFMMFLISLPVHYATYLGNYPIVSMTLFLGALVASEKNRQYLSGLLLAFSMFKYPLVLPFCIIFVLQKRWIPIAFCAVYHIIGHFILCWWIQANPITIFRDTCEISKFTMFYKSLALDSIVAIFFRWHGTNPYFEAAALTSLLGGILLFGKKFATRPISLFSFISMAILAISYHRTYDHIIFFFCLLWACTFKDGRVYKVLAFLMVWNFFFIRESTLGIPLREHFGYNTKGYDFAFYSATVFYLTAPFLIYKQTQQYKSWRLE